MKYLTKRITLNGLIFQFRGQRVMIDRDLANLYQVSTKALNQAVKRNWNRFPKGFMFRLTMGEQKELVTNCDRFITLKHTSHPPLAFTDYGVAMLSSVLRSQRAIKVNIQIIRVFIKLRSMVSERPPLLEKINQLENRINTHDSQIGSIFEAIRDLIEIPKNQTKKIGFQAS